MVWPMNYPLPPNCRCVMPAPLESDDTYRKRLQEWAVTKGGDAYTCAIACAALDLLNGAKLDEWAKNVRTAPVRQKRQPESDDAYRERIYNCYISSPGQFRWSFKQLTVLFEIIGTDLDAYGQSMGMVRK